MAASTGLRIALLVILSVAVPTLAGGGEPAAVRNCTWCHGTEVKGFATAPRLAGQRPQYIMNQLLDFRRHTRDAPFSRQFMWSAVENLSPWTAHDLQAIFRRYSLRPPMTETRNWLRPEEPYTKVEIPI